MKPNSILTSLAVLSLTVAISGCLEIKIRTSVATDGSSKRTVSVKLDKKELPYAAYPIPRDSSWSISWHEITEGKQTRNEYRAEKNFATPEALEREYNSLPDTGVLRVRVQLQKSFQWFYSYFEYEETYTLHDPFNIIPASAALTPEEIERYIYHSDSESGSDSVLNEKVEAWSKRNEMESLYQGFVAAAKQRNDPSIHLELVQQNKERFFSIFNVKSEKAAMKMEADITAFLQKTLGESVNSKAVHALKEDVGRAISDFEAKSERIKNHAYENSIQLPGLLTETNSEKVEGNTVAWKVKDKQLKVGEFRMRAQSRTTNVWAFVVSGVVGLALLAFVAVRFVRKTGP
jgi:hypothetical protein